MKKGLKASEETRRRMSEAKRGQIPWNKGGKLSEEHKKKIGESGKNREVSEKTKKKLSNINKGKKHTEETKKKISESGKGRPCPMKGKKHTEETKQKMSEAQSGENSFWKGKKHTEETKQKISESSKGENSSKWKGGYKVPLYDTYAHQLEPYEECRRNEKDPNVLEVKCAYCGKWHIPEYSAVTNRIGRMDTGHSMFYCSSECKQECPIYNQTKKYKGQEGYWSREVQPELRQLVFARDNWTCQKCGSQCSLHCHHIDPVKSNPIESADVDNGITLCKYCHKWVHMNIPGCGYRALADCFKTIFKNKE